MISFFINMAEKRIIQKVNSKCDAWKQQILNEIHHKIIFILEKNYTKLMQKKIF